MPTLETCQGVPLWHYVPSLPLAVSFAVLFGLTTLSHAWKMFSTRLWFCTSFLIGGVLEVVGYVARAAATNSTGALGPYLVQALFLVLPPVLFAATLYMVYSRVVRAVDGAAFSPIAPRWATILFVTGDFIALNVQGDAAGLTSKPNLARLGDWIIVAGMGFQILMFAAFVACCVVFNRRFRAHVAATGVASSIPWQASLNMLYGTSLAIVLRNIYRMTEFIMGQNGYLLDTEWPTYVFDGSLMLLVMVAFFIWYPSKLRSDLCDSKRELGIENISLVEHGHAGIVSQPGA